MTESVIQRNHLPVRLTPAVRSSDIQSGRVINASSPISQAMDKQLRRAQMGAGQGVQSQFFSPFRTRPSLETPTKRVDLNEWYRYYFKHDPYVGTAIELHATYPLSGFELEHEDKSLEQMFNEEAEELDLDSLYRRMGMEYWIVGEAFPFGFLDDPEHPQRWERFILLDPDKVKINKHQMAVGKHDRDYFIRLEPDADLKKIVNNGPNHPNTGPLYRNIPVDVIEAVKKGQSIALHPLQASHFKREVNPFNVRGESVISRVIQDLMYLDKLRDAQYAIADRHVCYDKETECLTKDGWKKYDELGWNDLIGTVNKDTGVLEWQRPEGFYINQYKGPMHHFGGSDKDKKIDIMVTPDHRMLVQELKYQGSRGYRPDLGRSLGNYGYDGEWKVVKSQDVRPKSKFRACVDDFKADHCPDFIEIDDDRYAIDDYLKMVGWYLSEGHLQRISDNAFAVSASQTVWSQHCAEFNELFDKCGFRKSINNQGTVIRTKYGTEFAAHFALHFGVRSWDKKVPVWVRNLPKDKLRILLDAMIAGDGHTATESEYNGKMYQRKYVQYYSVSKQLADDVQEMVFKLGFVPTMHTDPYLKKKSKLIGHTVQWSETSDAGKFPIVGRTKKDVSNQVDYDDVIWCVMVPNTFFVTRRNGKIAVQGNTPKEFYMIGEPGNEADAAELADFHNALMSTYHGYNSAIVWHHALKVQWEGASGRILPLKPEFDYVEKRLLSGLMMSAAFMHGEGPCCDDQTEVLTEAGWKLMKDVPDGERLAALDKHGNMQYEHFKDRIVKDYDGDMYYFNSKKYDMALTANHWQLFKDRDGEWKTLPVDQMPLDHVQLRCVLDSYKPDNKACDELVSQASELAGKPVSKQWLLRFLGFYTSEGSCILSPSNRSYQIRVSQDRDNECYEELVALMAECPWKVNTYERDQITEWVICNKRFAEWIGGVCGKESHNKHVPTCLKTATPDDICEFMDFLVFGDGNLRSQGKNKDQQYITYTTISKQLADDVHHLVLLCGFAPIQKQPSPATNNPCWRVYWSLSSDHGKFPWVNGLGRNVVVEHYTGKVYCFEVPSGYIMVRRNGKATVTHNTFANASVALDILIARYMQYREKLEGWSISHVFDPICRMNDIYKPTQAEIAHRIRIRNPVKKPWVPKVRWERGALRDDQFKIGLIKELVEKSFLPRVDLYRAINKDIKQVKQELATQAKDDRELRKNGDPIPGQPQAPAGLPGAPPPPSGGMGGGGGGKPPLPGAGLPPGAPKLPSLPQGTEGAVGAGTGPAMPAIAPGV